MQDTQPMNQSLQLFDQTMVMGILNVTPDSFSDGGQFNDLERAVAQAEQMVADGATVIDVGGESTRPGHTPVSAEEEIDRVVPVIQALSDHISVPISIDTFKAKTAEAAVRAGATIINDVWGAKHDPEIGAVAKKYNCPIILMHNQAESDYDDLMDDIKTSLKESIEIVKQQGVNDEQIILDPGVGFGKTHQQNLLAMRRMQELKTLGYPILLGTSRKSIVGKTLGLPVEERLEGTIATICQGVSQGVDIVRVHDVKEVKRAVDMMDAMLGKGWNEHGQD
ncbi:dihydropteroate synthase [Alkalibacillus almallahensis]|uniref:dihydropteroate synthase n=1 Tax=Alkalibacillus almallahensis TaxID=1379154 RepID=UPI00141F8239|nr:dihydropteroate synthase [Alkalibacillus almallahensis]NIK12686.1 dihydropteroate synthase [Alkalibacillus almallahensis]